MCSYSAPGPCFCSLSSWLAANRGSWGSMLCNCCRQVKNLTSSSAHLAHVCHPTVSAGGAPVYIAARRPQCRNHLLCLHQGSSFEACFNCSCTPLQGYLPQVVLMLGALAPLVDRLGLTNPTPGDCQWYATPNWLVRQGVGDFQTP